MYVQFLIIARLCGRNILCVILTNLNVVNDGLQNASKDCII